MAEQGCRAHDWALVIGAAVLYLLSSTLRQTLDLGADGAEQHRDAWPQRKVRRRRHSLRDARADRQIGKRNIEQRMAGLMQFRDDITWA
jgi:hypothetical protein